MDMFADERSIRIRSLHAVFIAVAILLLFGVGWIVWQSLNPTPIQKRVSTTTEIQYTGQSGKPVSVKIPFQITDCQIEETPNGARITLQLKVLSPEAVATLEKAVYVLGIHTDKGLIVYAHNSAALPFRSPAISKDDELLVLAKDYRVIATGEFKPQYDKNQIIIEVPVPLQLREVSLVRFRYLPSIADAKQVGKRQSGVNEFPIASSLRLSRPNEGPRREYAFP
ncbi:MAG: hypothetical protein KatS3mg016_0591 [Fimbriimonadales bacterium]|jgi:hypothetical protein|nr:MAG: hypothetical protein KatS3mg016_0591 [Fimbriimonadales bacterium]GIV10119.1 MAG: hypothetical protein KatS3mg019_2210 [Fimbriimonadales bacterium]